MTFNPKVPAEAIVVWEGDSLAIVRDFPEEVKRGLGEDIRRLQLGARPLDARPMKSIGPGVAELRQSDKNGWYRCIYLGVVDGKLHILHSFVKKSAKTAQKDLNTASRRLKAVRERIAVEKKRKK